ncbi:MAG: hypothetical protein AAF546_12140 [Verrucomicrobiota bacterium]
MNTFPLTKESEIPQLEGLGFWGRRKERIRLGRNDTLYQEELNKYGYFCSGWLSLSNGPICVIIYLKLGLNFWSILTTFLLVGLNVYLTTKFFLYLFLNHETLLAYDRAKG